MIARLALAMALCGVLGIHASTTVMPPSRLAIIVATKPSRGQVVAEDVAYILTGIANAPGGDKAIHEIIGEHRS